MAHSFVELDKAVVHVISLISFLWLWFSFCPLLWEEAYGSFLMGKTDWGKLSLVLMGRAMLHKSLVQFSVDGLICVPSLLFNLRPNYGGGNQDNGNLLLKVPCMHCCTQCPRPWSRPLLTHASIRDPWTLTGKFGWVSCGVTALFSWVLVCTVFCLCPKSLFPQSCVSSGSSLVGLMVTSSKRAYATPRSAAPRASAPLQATAAPVQASAGDTQRQVWLNLCGGLLVTHFFEPYEHLWWVQDFILNTISPLYHLAGASPLSLDTGCLFLVGSNVLLLMAVQQQVVILEFLQEKMSTCSSTLSSWLCQDGNSKYIIFKNNFKCSWPIFSTQKTQMDEWIKKLRPNYILPRRDSL